MKLYDIADQLRALDSMMPESHEDEIALEELYHELDIAFDAKAENIAKMVKNNMADVEAIKAEEDRLRSRRKALENKTQRLKEYLQAEMESTGIEKIKTDLFSIGIQKNPPSTMVNPLELPDEYWRVKREPDTARIKDALKAGEEIPGASLQSTRSIRIR